MRALGYIGACAIALLVAIWAWPCEASANAAGDSWSGAAAGAPAGAPAAGETYTLRMDGLPDSLRAELGADADDAGRRWSGAELESAALRIRDRLAKSGDAAATVRLVLLRGQGSAAGTASLELTRAVTPPSAAPVASGTGRPVIHAASPAPEPALLEAGADAYAKASRGATSVDAVAAGLSALRDVLIDAGYYGAEVGLDSLSMEAGAAPACAHLRVVSGVPAVVEAVELPGATATRPATAATIAGLRPGTRIRPPVLAEARERLVQSGLFVLVGDPRVTPGAGPGGVRVSIPVEEERTSRFEGAVGIAREGGITGLVDLVLGNIAGSGRTAGFRWFGPGEGRSEYAAHYREPTLFGRRADLTLELNAQVADSLFTETRWSLALGYRPAASSRATLAVSRSGSTFTGPARGSSETWSLAARAGVDKLVPALNPTGGFRISASGEAGRRHELFPGFPEQARGLFRGDFELAGVSRLGPRRALAMSVHARGAALNGGTFPAEELSFLGGSEGLRGHPDRAFAGSRVVSGSIEQRWITDDRGGRLYLFADAAGHDLTRPLAAGSVPLPSSGAAASASLARTMLSPGWEFGYGAGLRTRMASGLVGLELGLAPGEPLRRATIHVRYASTW